MFAFGLPGVLSDALLWWSWVGSGTRFLPWLVTLIGIAVLFWSGFHSHRRREAAPLSAKPARKVDAVKRSSPAETEAETMERLTTPIKPKPRQAETTRVQQPIDHLNKAVQAIAGQRESAPLRIAVAALIDRGQEQATACPAEFQHGAEAVGQQLKAESTA
jgi:hypothetical protein